MNKNKRISLPRQIVQGIGLISGCLGVIVPAMTHIVFPGLHCYACPLSVTICSIGIMQNLLKTGFPLFPIAFLGLYGVLLGRWWCGWICPFGLVNDIFLRLNTRQKSKQVLTLGAGIVFVLLTAWFVFFTQYKFLYIIPGTFMLFAVLVFIIPYVSPGLKKKMGRNNLIGALFIVFAFFFVVVLFLDHRLVVVLIPAIILFILALTGGMVLFYRKKRHFVLKYIILILTIGLAVIAADTLFCKLCPSAAISASLPYLITNPSFVPGTMYWVKLGILIFTVFCLISVSRFFCRYLCPLGAIFGLANKISLLKIIRKKGCDTFDKHVCKHACVKSCIMGIKDIHKQKVLTQTDCIKCGKCIEACPGDNLRFSGTVEEPIQEKL